MTIFIKLKDDDFRYEYHRINDIPNYLNDKIIYLYCSSNKLTNLQNYPNLKYLSCSFNDLTSLPQYPNLQELYCSNNQLTSLPEYPKLEKLDCYDNQLISLPEYPNLQYLYCCYNQLTSLPKYPNLQELYCGNNKLTSLPKIHNWNNLQYIDYYNNPIENIHPRTMRVLENLRRRFRGDNENNTVYNDNQNVHNHTIQSSIKESINVLLDQVFY
jgi:Leucine-rich repeat (LRR) protein